MFDFFQRKGDGICALPGSLKNDNNFPRGQILSDRTFFPEGDVRMLPPSLRYVGADSRPAITGRGVSSVIFATTVFCSGDGRQEYTLHVGGSCPR